MPPAVRDVAAPLHRWPGARRYGGPDLLRLPLLGPFLRWKHARTALQLPVLLVALVLIAHGLLGPRLAPRNLAPLVTWVHYRGLLVLALLVAGNLFCMACPFVLVRDLARRFRAPTRAWPRRLRNKWAAAALLAGVLFAYEALDLWGSPAGTAWLILAFFGAALLVDGLFRHAPFCKYVCPLGQFNFVAATVSPLEVRVSDPGVCASCTTLDCIRGTRDPLAGGRVLQRGCELALFQPLKHGNLDCTFCLDCVHACPHDNVAIGVRLPASELWDDARRSGVGRPSTRPDLGVLAVVFAFGAMLNAFAMASPAYAAQAWLSRALGGAGELPALAGLFGLGLVIEPALLLGLAAWGTRRAAGGGGALLPLAVRFAYALVPLGLGVWAGHYGFHFLTGMGTVIPVAQRALIELGLPLGPPDWTVAGLPPAWVTPLELGLVGLGAVGSGLVAWRIAGRDFPGRQRAAAAPWLALVAALGVAAAWLMTQPMEMRGAVLGG